MSKLRKGESNCLLDNSVTPVYKNIMKEIEDSLNENGIKQAKELIHLTEQNLTALVIVL